MTHLLKINSFLKTDIVRGGDTIYETRSMRSHLINPPTKHTDKLYSAFRGPSCNQLHFGITKIGDIRFSEIKKMPSYNIYEPLCLYHGERSCIKRSSGDDKNRLFAHNFLAIPNETFQKQPHDFRENEMETKLRERMKTKSDSNSFAPKMLEVQSEEEIKKSHGNINNPILLHTRKSPLKPHNPNVCFDRIEKQQNVKNFKQRVNGIQTYPTAYNKQEIKLQSSTDVPSRTFNEGLESIDEALELLKHLSLDSKKKKQIR